MSPQQVRVSFLCTTAAMGLVALSTKCRLLDLAESIPIHAVEITSRHSIGSCAYTELGIRSIHGCKRLTDWQDALSDIVSLVLKVWTVLLPWQS